MTVATTLTILRDRDVLGVEGFATFDQAAGWTRACIDEIYRGYWNAVVPNTHDDVREVLTMLDTLDQQARFLVLLDYPREQVEQALRGNFPIATPEELERAIAAAENQRRESQEAVEQQIEAEGARALAAEHDLNTTMHEEG